MQRNPETTKEGMKSEKTPGMGLSINSDNESFSIPSIRIDEKVSLEKLRGLYY